MRGTLRRPIETLTIPANQSKKIQAGKFYSEDLQGKMVPEIDLVVTFPVANAGAAAPALTETQRKVLLDALRITLKNGPKGDDTPLNAETGSQLRDREREILRRECIGFEDNTDGMQQLLPTGTTDLEVTLAIPCGVIPRLRQFRKLGMGPTQLRTLELEIEHRAVSAGLPAGITMAGDVTVAVYAKRTPAIGDPIVDLVKLYSSSLVGKVLTLADGFPLAVWLRDVAHLSTTLTELRTWIGGKPILDRDDPERYLEHVLADLAETTVPSGGGDISDDHTYLHTLPGDVDLEAEPESVQVGTFAFSDDNQTLASIDYGAFMLAERDDAFWRAWAEYATQFYREDVLLTSTFSVRGMDAKLPSGFQPYMGGTIVSVHDKIALAFAGWLAGKNRPAVMHVPEAGKGRVRSAAQANERAGAGRLAASVIDRAALAVLGSVRGATVAGPVRSEFERRINA